MNENNQENTNLNDKESGEKTLTLKELRETLGLSQEKMAAKSNLTRNSIGSYEAGDAEPKLSNFVAMARTLGVSLKTLAKSMGVDVRGIPDDTPKQNSH